MNLLFFDSSCPFCRSSVAFLLKIDRDKILQFAPLKGITADNVLIHEWEPLKRANSLVFIESSGTPNQRAWLYGRGVFRILFLIGGFWALPGLLYLFPKWLVDPAYRFIARHRHHLSKTKKKETSLPKERLLP